MKPSSYLIIVLLAILVFGCAFFIFADFKQHYPEVEINESWEGIYNETQESTEGINASTSSLIDAIEKMTSQESSFLDKIVGGAVLLGIIPYMAGEVVVQGARTALLLPMVAEALGVPLFVIRALIVMFWVVLVFALITVAWRFAT